MKAWLTKAIIVLMLSATGITVGSSSSKGVNQDLLRRPINNLDLEAANIGLLLDSFSAQTKVPTGLELSSDDDLSIPKRIRLEIKHGTLRDVLDSVVKQNPLYEWKIEDEVVNIFPKSANRDALLKEVLETKLDKFSIDRGMTRFSFRQALTTTQALKSVLLQHKVVPINETFMSRDFDPLGRNYTLEASNLSISTLLNQVVRDSQTKSWIVLRYGEKKQYLVINL